MRDNLLFLKHALQEIKTVWSVTESSKYLVKKMIVPIPFCHNNLIVELGAGNGCITQALLKKLEEQSRMISFELHPAFFNKIRHLSSEQCTIVNDNALNILNFVDSQSVDAIVSWLPLANIGTKIKQAIITEVKKSMKEDWLFIQFQYSLYDYKFLKKNFKSVKVQFCALNVPPAFIYICKK